MTPIGTFVMALLADGRLLETWLDALRRRPECRSFVALVESPPVTVVSSRGLARSVRIGERSLRRHVLLAVGSTPLVVILSVKLARAARRFGGESSIKVIASDEGFSTEGFDHLFRRHLGTSPLKFRPPDQVTAK